VLLQQLQLRAVNTECTAGICGLKRAFDAVAGAASEGVRQQNMAVQKKNLL
jgi:hypothetical protein